MQPLACGSLHRLTVARADLADCALDVAVEQFVRVQFRGTAGQEEQFDLVRR